ncbi:MAG: transporter suffix domain-containing protein [Deinococcus sp.]|nr:transporter suffix domain-containing protein [Deinococcus sp.]MCL5964809.1 transporter suffix domain-containing protein [Deinococcus sp.]
MEPPLETDQASADTATHNATKRLGLAAKAGLGLIVLSTLLWVALPAIPFLPLSTSQKASLVVAVLVVAEALFLAGVLLAGKEVAKRYRSWLSPRRLWQRLAGKTGTFESKKQGGASKDI